MKFSSILIVGFLSTAALGQQFKLSRAPPLVSVRLATEGSFPNSNRGRFKNDISENKIDTNRRFQNDITLSEASENVFQPFTGLENDITSTVTSENSFETNRNFQSNNPPIVISETFPGNNIGFQSSVPSTGASDDFISNNIGFQNNIPSIGTSKNVFQANAGFQNSLPITGSSENIFQNNAGFQNSFPSSGTTENSFETNIGFQNNIPSVATAENFIENNIGLKNNIPLTGTSVNSLGTNKIFQNSISPFGAFGSNPFPATLLTPVMLTSDERTGTISFTSARPSSRRLNQITNKSNFQFTFPSVSSTIPQQRPRDTPIRPASTFLTTNSPDQVFFEPLNLPSGASALLGTISTRFSCEGLPYGYYADPDNSCNIFHICNPTIYEDGFINTFQYSFMCGETLVFDQQELACVTPDNISHACSDAPRYFYRNEIFGSGGEA